MKKIVEVCPINAMVLGKTEYKEGDRQGLGFGDVGDPAPTISTVHGHAAAMSYDGYNQSGAEEACHTLRTGTGGESCDTTPKVAVADSMRYIVRRLTPLECERLMGYPEGHTIPSMAVSEALVDEFVQVFVDYAKAIGKESKPPSRNQVRKWLKRITNAETCPDAPRYKACGNGWAINCARWVLQGIDTYLTNCDKYERNTHHED